jgi:excinuclease ABC subunit C
MSSEEKQPAWKRRLQAKLGLLPRKPGVYLWKDGRGKILYIGKAKQLPSRVRSYFSGRPVDQRHQILRDRIRDLDYIVTSSETEALILEANLIKSHTPFFNIDLKDDKKYPFIKVDLKHDYPRVSISRTILADGSRYFGPYVRVGRLQPLMRALRRVFPLRNCSNHRFRNRGRECLEYHVGACPAPCTGRADPDTYRKTAKLLVRFLEGRYPQILKKLETRMLALSEELRFEESARIRDDIELIEKLQMRQTMTDMDRPDLDAVALAVRGALAAVIILSHRDGKVVGSWRTRIGSAERAAPEAIMNTVLPEHYQGRTTIPKVIACNVLPSDNHLLTEWLRDLSGHRISIEKPSRGAKARLLKVAEENAKLLLEEIELMEEGRRKRLDSSLYILQEGLNLPKPPRWIEGYDISNIQGTNTVGSQVVFKDGLPYKSGYRKYRIKTVTGSDDFASLAEVLTRRLKRLKESPDQIRPDLILIDGGKGQVNRAASVIAKSGITGIPLIGLAKREEEIFFPGNSEPVIFKRTSPGLQLLQRVRDEAHRFAITYHRKLRSEPFRKTPLETIPGLGKEKRKALLSRFGTIHAVLAADPAQLQEADGIGPSLARRIYDTLHRKESQS